MTDTRIALDRIALDQVVARRSADFGAPISPCSQVRAGGRVVAEATTTLLTDSDGTTVHVHITRVAGHQPPWARRLLVHDVLNRAKHAGLGRVLMVLPLGDTEVLDALHEHCDTMSTRPAGSTCIVEAELDNVTRKRTGSPRNPA